jgi:hypothetical protein
VFQARLAIGRDGRANGDQSQNTILKYHSVLQLF